MGAAGGVNIFLDSKSIRHISEAVVRLEIDTGIPLQNHLTPDILKSFRYTMSMTAITNRLTGSFRLQLIS